MGKGDKGQEEYEVQSILEARLEKKRGKKPVLLWKYRVRWKGYTAEEDTWEPKESFEGSEDIIEHFWERANTDGRDYRDVTLFNVGEDFFPAGPPRRKMKRKLLNETHSTPHTPEQTSSKARSSPQINEEKKQTSSSKRRLSACSPELPESDPPAKRMRGRNSEPSANAKSSHHDFQHEQSTGPTPMKATTKAPRDAASQSSKRRKQKKRRTPSPEIIPGSSDEEIQMIPPETSTPRKDTVSSQLAQDVPPLGMPTPPDDTRMNEEPDPLFDEDVTEKEPAHRARVTKPLVKMVDDADATALEGAISAKAHIMARGKTGPSSAPRSPQALYSPASGSQRIKPGPGRSSEGLAVKKSRSSLLTFQKGGLTTVKGKYVKPERQIQAEITEQTDEIGEVPMDDIAGPSSNDPPPSGEELLKLAGLDSSAVEELPAFEDDVPQEQSAQQQQQPAQSSSESLLEPQQQQEDTSSMLRKSINSAKDKLFPSTLANAITESAKVANAAWNVRPTIFDPLASGSQSIIKTMKNIASAESSSESASFFLTLDSSVSIPVLLTDASSPNEPSLHSVIGASGPPGKFYGSEAALPLIAALCTGGPSARVVIDNKASEEDKKHFDLFSTRLEKGDLFLAMAGVQFLAFCSSSNSIIAQGLNLPPGLVSTMPGSILVCRVSVENYSDYADLAGRADDIRWVQYVSNFS